MKAGAMRLQKGAAAIEFAVVFMLFFAMFYGLVSYTLPVLMLQSFNHASSEAVRHCVAVDPASKTYDMDVQNVAHQVIAQQLAWMPSALNFSVMTDTRVTVSADKVLTVVIDYPRERLVSVMPVLVLPLIGEVPRLPERLKAQASLQL